MAGAPTTREQSLLAAVLWAGTDALVSHRAAGELWGFDGVRATKPEISVPANQAKRSSLAVVHNTRSPGTQRRTRRSIPTTTPERTLIDLAGVLNERQLEIAFESARRERLVTAGSVQRALGRLGAQGRRGCEQLRTLITHLSTEPPAESVLEVLAARLLRRSDLPAPQRQVTALTPSATYRLDFAWPEQLVALECDGRQWHEAAFERDRRRWSAIAAATGYRIVWATNQRIKEQPQAIVAELRALLAQAAEPPSPRERGLRRRVGIGMTLSVDEPTIVSRARPERVASSMAPTRADADG